MRTLPRPVRRAAWPVPPDLERSRRSPTPSWIGLTLAALIVTAPPTTRAESTPAAVIQRHAIPSGTPTPPPPPPTPTPIPCDCDGNRVIGIDELVQAVRILLNGESADACGGLDRDRDGVLSVAELVVGVLHALYGCAALALTDGVFDANVFYGPAIIFFGPAAVHEDAGGTVALAIEYGVGRSITARGRLAPDGALRLVAERRDAGVARLSSGTGSVRVIDATYRLEALLEERELPLVGISLVREVRGTPAVWAGDYDLTLMRERGAASTVALSVAVASSGFGRCEGQGASEWAPDRLRAGACSVSPFGGFHFATALLAETGGAEEIVLSGLLEDHDGAVTGHGNWGVGADGTVLGSWSAVRRSD